MSLRVANTIIAIRPAWLGGAETGGAMFKLRGSRPAGGEDASLRESDEMWPLPDMEAVESSEIGGEHHAAASFLYEEVEPHPAGIFTAELTGWRPLEGHRAAWSFRVVPQDDVNSAPAGQVAFVTGTVCRPDNHLYRLLTAVGLAPDAHSREELLAPDARRAIRDSVKGLHPETLVGRRCRIEVEHVRDDLGDVTARVTTVAPIGAM